MNEVNYTLRLARPQDVMDIWLLLHGESLNPVVEQIAAQLDNLYVLVKDSQIIGVLAGNPRPPEPSVNWVVIHPLHPQKILQDFMSSSFQTRQAERGRLAFAPLLCEN